MVENAYDFEVGSFSYQAPQDVSLYKLQERNLVIFFLNLRKLFKHKHNNLSSQNTKKNNPKYRKSYPQIYPNILLTVVK